MTHQNFLKQFGIKTFVENVQGMSDRRWVSNIEMKKRHPNPGIMGGVKTMSNKKGFRCRTVVIRSALDSPDLGRASKYPEHCDNTFRKKSREL